MSFWRFVSATAVAMFMLTSQALAADPENTLYLDLQGGRVVIEMRPDLAPQHVERMKTLARSTFFDNTPIHRVIEGFMAQMGDPTGTGTGGSDFPDLQAEFNDAKHVRGVVSMARSQNPNSANSQFFIMFGETPQLDGQYTVWGKVVEGMEHVDQIKRGQGRNGSVRQPDRIVQMRVAADVED
jgi:peptidylprolyl isomerase